MLSRKSTLSILVAACIAASSNTATAQSASSFESTVVNKPELVTKFIETMKLLGGDGSITFASAWTKSKLKDVKSQIDQVRMIQSQYLSNYNDSVIESKMAVEEQDVCEKWGEWTESQEKYDSDQYHSKSNHNFHLALSLGASAGAGGVVDAGDDYGDNGGGAGELDASASLGFGLGYHSRSEKDRQSVHYFYVHNGLKCDKSSKYQRVVVRLTPDLLTLNPQQAASLIYTNFESRLSALRENLEQVRLVTEAVADNPIFQPDDMLEKFSDLRIVQQMQAGHYKSWPSFLAAFSDQYKKSLTTLRDSLLELKANAVVTDNFKDELSVIDASYHQVINMLASLEAGGFSLGVNATGGGHLDEVLASQNFIATLNGTALSSTIKNASLLITPDPFNEDLIAAFTGTVLHASNESLLGNISGSDNLTNRLLKDFNFRSAGKIYLQNKSCVYDTYDEYYLCPTTEKEIKTMQEIYRRVTAGTR